MKKVNSPTDKMIELYKPFNNELGYGEAIAHIFEKFENYNKYIGIIEYIVIHFPDHKYNDIFILNWSGTLRSLINLNPMVNEWFPEESDHIMINDEMNTQDHISQYFDKVRVQINPDLKEEKINELCDKLNSVPLVSRIESDANSFFRFGAIPPIPPI